MCSLQRPLDTKTHLRISVEAEAILGVLALCESGEADHGGDKMSIQPKPLSEVTQQAIDLLFKEIGIVNTVRFLNQFTTGYGNYTEEREALFKDLTLDEIVVAVRKVRDKGNA